MLRISALVVVLALANAATDALGENKAGHTQHNITDTGKSVLWIAFFGLFLPTIYFAFEMLRMPEGKRKFHIITFGVTAIASLAYLTMACGYGVYEVPRMIDGKIEYREFFYARYVDWAFTTPLQLLDILGFAGAPDDTTLWILGVDFLMIAAGLIGAFLPTVERYYFWMFGMVMFAPILHALFSGLKPNAANKSAAVQAVFNKISLLTAISWSAYPVVWLLAEGAQKVTPDEEAVAYTVLDIIAKSVFGFLIISARDACGEA